MDVNDKRWQFTCSLNLFITFVTEEAPQFRK